MSLKVAQALRKIVGENNVLELPEDVLPYTLDASIIYKGMPTCVVRPHSTEEVSKIVKFANENRIPVVPRGAGTNLVGAAVPPNGGIVVDLTGMNRILEINTVDLRCTVEAGVVHAKLESELAKYGLFWPPDPGSSDSCTMGGVIAMNAGGMRALKYGTTRDWVLGLKVVLPNGEVIKTGSKTFKGNAGYDLTRLFVGSEGTLGIITEATLKLRPIPEAESRICAYFDSIEKAGVAVSKIYMAGIVPAAMELMDKGVIIAVNKWLGKKFPEMDACLIVSVDGSKEEVGALANKVERVLKESGASQVLRATTQEEFNEIWLIRSEGATALPNVTGKMNVTHDVCVPISKLPEVFKEIRKICEKYGIPVAILSHAGDGNVHAIFSVNLKDPEETAKAKKAHDEMCRYIIKIGGTISGEHGIGIDKAELLVEEVGPVAMELMRSIKRLLDPNNIMNPGKMGV
ncbi:MAG: FAD-binding oxidoreductase [Thaumarchaeota archaeon]|jgi:glycolate oxidase|nr:FAD-binding oxidoreductase [Candidatus Terraquivivens yellowstonensis]